MHKLQRPVTGEKGAALLITFHSIVNWAPSDFNFQMYWLRVVLEALSSCLKEDLWPSHLSLKVFAVRPM